MLDRSTTEKIYLLRGLIELYKDRKKDLHMMFIVLEKAYDKVPHEVLWRGLIGNKRSVAYVYSSN